MDGVTVKISVFLESDRSLSGGRRRQEKNHQNSRYNKIRSLTRMGYSVLFQMDELTDHWPVQSKNKTN